jgi:hypothetical protein
MDQLIPILVYIVLGLIGFGLLVMAVFGLKGLATGKTPIIRIALIGAPLLLAGVMALVWDDPAEGVIVALLVTFVVALVALLFTGIKGIFT